MVYVHIIDLNSKYASMCTNVYKKYRKRDGMYIL